MKVSVVMITYNREQFVGKMIEDMLKQSFSEFEYIIIDNGSKDSSGRIAEEYACKDKRIRVLHLQEGISIGAARNIGLRESRGEFLTYIDDDDRVTEDFLQSLYLPIQKSETVDFTMCGATEEIEKKIYPQCLFEGTVELTAKDAVTELLKRERIRAGMPTKLFRRSILLKYPFREDCRHEDIHTIYKYLSEIRKGVIYGEPKYCFIRHGKNISFFSTDSKRITPEQLEEYLDAFHKRTGFIKEKFPELEEFSRYCEWSYMISMCHKIVENDLDNCKEKLEGMLQELRKNKSVFEGMHYIKDFEKEWIGQFI